MTWKQSFGYQLHLRTASVAYKALCGEEQWRGCSQGGNILVHFSRELLLDLVGECQQQLPADNEWHDV